MVPVVLGPQKQAILKTKNKLNSVLTKFHLKNNGQFVKNQIKEFNIKVTDDEIADSKELDAAPFSDEDAHIDEASTDEDVDINEGKADASEEEEIKVVAKKPKTKVKTDKKANKVSKAASTVEKVVKKVKKVKTETPSVKTNIASPPPMAKKKINKKEILKRKKGKIAKITTSATRLTMPVC